MKKALVTGLTCFGLFLVMGFQPIQTVRVLGYIPATCVANQTPPIAYQGYIYNCVNGTFQKAGPGSGVNVATTATSGGTTTLDLSTGNIQTVTFPAGNTTLAFTNVPTGNLTLFLIQDSVGGRTVTWPATALFAGGTKPTLTTTANARDQFNFICNGTNCYLMNAVYDVR